MNNSDIGKKLKSLRKGRKLTQVQAADKLGLSRCTVSNYECGRRSPHLTDLERMAKFYGVGLDYFGVVPTDEVFDLLERARRIFENPDVPSKKKEELFLELSRFSLYLNKGE